MAAQQASTSKRGFVRPALSVTALAQTRQRFWGCYNTSSILALSPTTDGPRQSGTMLWRRRFPCWSQKVVAASLAAQSTGLCLQSLCLPRLAFTGCSYLQAMPPPDSQSCGHNWHHNLSLNMCIIVRPNASLQPADHSTLVQICKGRYMG